MLRSICCRKGIEFVAEDVCIELTHCYRLSQQRKPHAKHTHDIVPCTLVLRYCVLLLSSVGLVRRKEDPKPRKLGEGLAVEPAVSVIDKGSPGLRRPVFRLPFEVNLNLHVSLHRICSRPLTRWMGGRRRTTYAIIVCRCWCRRGGSCPLNMRSR